jgi:hypothetical protein
MSVVKAFLSKASSSKYFYPKTLTLSYAVAPNGSGSAYYPYKIILV